MIKTSHGYRSFVFLVLIGLLFIPTLPTLAHPGRTASDGCHYCRTNCAKWGVTSGARHCHRSKGISQPSEPVRSHYSETGGYTTPAPDYKIPKTKTISPAETKKVKINTQQQKTTPKSSVSTQNDKKPITPTSNKINTRQTATVIEGEQQKEEKTFWFVRFLKFIFGF